MALSVAGGGLGFVVFPMVLSALMSFYGLRGTLLLCSALYLNGLVFGAIYRPKEKRPEKKKNGSFVFQIRMLKVVLFSFCNTLFNLFTFCTTKQAK